MANKLLHPKKNQKNDKVNDLLINENGTTNIISEILIDFENRLNSLFVLYNFTKKNKIKYSIKIYYQITISDDYWINLSKDWTKIIYFKI